MWPWIFLDVGNVLLDEDPLTYFVFRRYAAAVERVRPDVSFDDVLAAREARASAGLSWAEYEAVTAFLSAGDFQRVWEETADAVSGRRDELSPLIPGAVALVERLSRVARLGLIANQDSGCRARLQAHGLLEPFEVIAFSEEQQWCSKPDLGLFQFALRAAGARPSDCLMIGDRLDNDVAPASALGMATAWVRWPDRAAKGWRPEEPEARAYLTSLERSARQAARLLPAIQPTLVCDETRQLAEVLETQGEHRGSNEPVT